MAVRVHNRVRGWDDFAFAQLTRSIELSLIDGNLERAHSQLDAFATGIKAVTRKVLELGDSVAQLVEPETAGLLQKAGYQNISSLVYASDADLLSIPFLGKGRLERLRAALEEHGFIPKRRKIPVLTPA